VVAGFTTQYDVARLVWFEMHGDMAPATTREKWLRINPTGAGMDSRLRGNDGRGVMPGCTDVARCRDCGSTCGWA
jgi:hypothetical protein